jgi:RHS repeat-associated protein
MRPSGGVAHFAAHDGNGNVIGLVDGGTGQESARYEYDPFGNTIRLSGTGTIAKDNPFRFSTKRTERESGLVLYEYRPYSTAFGRWPNRDPIEENGGANLYGFVRNAPSISIDRWGLCEANAVRNVKCTPHVSDWLSNPTLDGGKDELMQAVGDVDKLSIMMSFAATVGAAGKGAVKFVEQSIENHAGNNSTPDAQKVAAALLQSLTEGRGNGGGWSLYTKIEYEECVPFCVLFSRWRKGSGTDWKEYVAAGVDGKGLFETKIDAYKFAKKACDLHLEEFRISRKQ